jgi:hippurate hydrolase
MPSEVRLTGTVRTFDAGVQDTLEAALRSWVEHVARAGGCSADLEYVRYYPATINDAACAQHALETARALFGQALLAESPAATSEDFAYMLQQVPGAYIWLGSRGESNSRPLHDPAFDFNDDILPVGAALLAALAERRLSI